jgi:hypothetical protein
MANESTPLKNSSLQQAKEILKKDGYVVSQKIVEKRDGVFQRFPLLFTLLGTFGLVATLYGFENIMDEIGLSERPFLLLGIGIITLVITGGLYKKLND